MTALPATAPAASAAGPRGRAGIAAALLLLTMVVLATVGPFLAPQDPGRTIGTAYLPAAADLPLGTDNLGRDVLSRFLAGGWPVLVLPAVTVVVSTAIGVAAGLALAAGRGRGRRSVQVLDLLLVLPPILVLVLLAFALGTGVATLLVIVVVLNSPFTARNVRAVADPLYDTGYVQVAITAGHSRAAVVLHEILPNVRGPILADAGNRLVGAVYLIASAGFLGLSPLPGTTNWATMAAESLGGITLNPQAVVAPALAIGAVAVSTNLLADRWGADRWRAP